MSGSLEAPGRRPVPRLGVDVPKASAACHSRPVSFRPFSGAASNLPFTATEDTSRDPCRLEVRPPDGNRQEEQLGYDLHITRADDWNRNESHEIAPQEWLSLIEEDPELVLDPAYGEYAVTWKHPTARKKAWFDYYGGNVYTTNPDKATVEKMLALASRLDARVMGDNGELYNSAPDW
jgi:hypothetical protein